MDPLYKCPYNNNLKKMGRYGRMSNVITITLP